MVLMLANAVKTRKGSADHLHLEVVAATGEVLHLNGGIGKGMANGILHLIRMHHGGTEWVRWNLEAMAADGANQSLAQRSRVPGAQLAEVGTL